MSPDAFISVAEETGLIIPIGEWVLKTALVQLKKWHENGMKDLTMSVNLSIRQFYQPNLISMIREALGHAGVEPHFLTVEITESMTMDVEKASVILRGLKELGVKLHRDLSGLSQGARRIEERAKSDERLKEKLEQLVERVDKSVSQA